MKCIYIMYSYTQLGDTRIHGIFTEDEIKNFREERKSVHASVMTVPLNKFVEKGVIL